MDAKMEMESWREATTETNDTVNRNPETYSLTCACCNDDVEYKKFYDFLQHARKQHLPQNTKSELNTSHRAATPSRIALKVCLSTANVEPSGSRTAITTNNNAGLLNDYNIHYDLRRIPRAALVNFINLFSKCLCLWHKSTRMRVSSRERFCAYHLLLSKLREHQMQVTLNDVRNIVKQLMKNFEMDIMHPKTPRLGDDMSKYRLQPTKSRTIVNKLMFLSASNCKPEELNISKVCEFCYTDFFTYEALWVHMKNSHIPINALNNYEEDYLEFQPSSSNVKWGGRNGKDDKYGRNNCDRLQVSYSNTHQHPSDSCLPTSSDHCWINVPSSKRKCSRSSNHRLGSLGKPEKRCRVEMSAKRGTSKSKNSPISNYLVKNRDHLLINFIEQLEQLECLWKQNSNLFRNQKVRNDAIEALVETQKGLMPQKTTINSVFIKALIKELKQYYQSYKAGGMKHSLSKYKMIWERLRFLDAANPGLYTTNNGTVSQFNCARCNSTFKTMKNFNLHMLRYHPPTECYKCNKNFNTADDLREHVMCRHVEDDQCPLCCQNIGAGDNDESLKTHLSNHFFDHSCITCGKVFHDSQGLSKHNKKCLYAIHLKCWHCPETFKDLRTFYEHAWRLHRDDRPFKCDDCHICFKYLRSLNKHRTIHRSAANRKSIKI